MKLKHALWTICLGALAWCTVAEAHLRPSPGEFGFEAEWIYFRTSIDNPYFALAGEFDRELPPDFLSAVIFSTTLENNDFDYQSGYRVGAAYHFCCPDLTTHIRWIQHWSDTSRTLNGKADVGIGISQTILLSSRTKVKNSLHFHTFDAVCEVQVFCDPCCFDLLLFGGLQYSSAEGKKRLDYQALQENPTAPFLAHISERACFYGVGPELGVDFSYSLGCGFGVTGNGRCGLLVSHMKMRAETSKTRPVQNNFVQSVTQNSIEKNWRLVPTCDMRLGLHYGCAWSCASLDLEVGYEALSLFRALPIGSQVVSEGYWNIDGYSNVDFHGPYLNFAVTF